MIDAELLKILACPWCVTQPVPNAASGVRGELELQGEDAGQARGLKCKQCGRFYKIEDGIPNLLIEDAVADPRK